MPVTATFWDNFRIGEVSVVRHKLQSEISKTHRNETIFERFGRLNARSFIYYNSLQKNEINRTTPTLTRNSVLF